VGIPVLMKLHVQWLKTTSLQISTRVVPLVVLPLVLILARSQAINKVWTGSMQRVLVPLLLV
jgi:hypothetical protein